MAKEVTEEQVEVVEEAPKKTRKSKAEEVEVSRVLGDDEVSQEDSIEAAKREALFNHAAEREEA